MYLCPSRPTKLELLVKKLFQILPTIWEELS